MNEEWAKLLYDQVRFDWFREDPSFDFTFEKDTQFENLYDAGFAASTEDIYISNHELMGLPADEWALFQRLISEPVHHFNTVVRIWQSEDFGVRERFCLTIEHDVPCITTLRE